MTEPSTQDRLAALAARRGQSPPKKAVDTEAVETQRTSRPAGSATRKATSSARIVTAGASALSFGAMVVAMGPLLQSTVDNELATDAADAAASVAGVGSAIAPNVVVEVVPNPASLVDPGEQVIEAIDPGTGLPWDPAAVADDAAGSIVAPSSSSSATATPAQTSPQATNPPQNAPPQTAPPQTAPLQTAPPQTEPPQTAPLQTEPPQTAPPQTAPPQTAPPQTAPPAPPTTQASG